MRDRSSKREVESAENMRRGKSIEIEGESADNTMRDRTSKREGESADNTRRGKSSEREGESVNNTWMDRTELEKTGK